MGDPMDTKKKTIVLGDAVEGEVEENNAVKKILKAGLPNKPALQVEPFPFRMSRLKKDKKKSKDTA